MAKKVIVIGLDCAPPDLVFEKWKNDLPVLKGLTEKGLYGPLKSTDPPTLPMLDIAKFSKSRFSK